MRNFTRRALLKSSAIGAAATAVASFPVTLDAPTRNGRIRQSVCQWCYPHIPLDQLAEYAAKIGLRGVDLLQPDEYEIPRRYDLICTMGYAGGGDIKKALNRA
jgi:hydroxypyruvate isomerase